MTTEPVAWVTSQACGSLSASSEVLWLAPLGVVGHVEQGVRRLRHHLGHVGPVLDLGHQPGDRGRRHLDGQGPSGRVGIDDGEALVGQVGQVVGHPGRLVGAVGDHDHADARPVRSGLVGQRRSGAEQREPDQSGGQGSRAGGEPCS